jgi:parallel beta-helix repeat protein
MQIVVAFLLLLCSAPAFAQVHVGPSQLYPDLGAAIKAKAIKAGDTVYLHAGTYRDQSELYFAGLNGASDKWITIRPHEDDSVVITEQWTFTTAQYLRIQGLHFFGNDPSQSGKVYHQLYFDYQYNCFGAIHDIIVEDCLFSDLNNSGKQASGAMLKFTGTDRFLVQNCVFRNGTNIADGISMNGDRNGIIRNCTFENLSLFGSHCKGGSQNITYEKNTFINCLGGGIEVGGDTGPAFFCPLDAPWEADSIKVYSNVFIGGSTGIRLSGCSNSEVINNTCFKTTQFAFRILDASSHTKVANNKIYNNIFTTYSPNGIYMNGSGGLDFSTQDFRNNLFHDYRRPDPAAINWSEMPSAVVQGTIIADPLFADTATRDFSLRKGSPAIGAGYPVDAPSSDLNDNAYSTPRSIGAVESGVSLGVAKSSKEVVVRITPNPAASSIDIKCDDAVIDQVVILDLNGRRVLTSYSATGTIDVSTLAAGEYLLIANANGFDLPAERLVIRR